MYIYLLISYIYLYFFECISYSQIERDTAKQSNI